MAFTMAFLGNFLREAAVRILDALGLGGEADTQRHLLVFLRGRERS